MAGGACVYHAAMSRPATRQEKDFAGLIALAIGAGICAIGGGLFPSVLESANAPTWIVLGSGGLFVLSGLSLFAQERTPAWVTGLLANLLLTLFAAIPAWIATEGRADAFSLSFGAGASGVEFGAMDVMRLAFGGVALLIAVIALFAWLHWLATLSWYARGYLLAGGLLAWYGLFVMLPAEPRWPELADDHARLARYSLLVEDGGWARLRGSGPRRDLFPPWHNLEDWTKAARDRLAAARVAPPESTLLEIPALAAPPRIDGRIDAGEWQGALRVDLQPDDKGSTVLLAADQSHLYLAAEAPADTTADGYDQFRFWFHIGLSPWLVSERVHLDRAGTVLALRQSRYPWGDNPPRSRSDWRIYARARGATTVAGHRRYELVLDLAESGIRAGVPFPGWLEIEGDPLRDAAGKFRARNDLGRAGSHQAPLWLRIAPR